MGDDVAAIAAKAELPCPVYTVDSGGIAGDFPEGYQIALLRVIEEIKKYAKAKTENVAAKPSVNLLGLTPTYFRGEEDIKEIRRILEKAGYRVNAIPGGGSSWDEIMELPHADLNIVLRDELALKAAKELENEFGTPYLSTGMPYGITGTLNWLEKINAALPGKNLEVVKEEAEKVNARLQFRSSNMQSLWGPLWFDNILIAAPPSEAAGIAEAVRGEWADTGNLVIHFTQDTPLRPAAANKICIAGKDDGK